MLGGQLPLLGERNLFIQSFFFLFELPSHELVVLTDDVEMDIPLLDYEEVRVAIARLKDNTTAAIDGLSVAVLILVKN